MRADDFFSLIEPITSFYDFNYSANIVKSLFDIIFRRSIDSPYGNRVDFLYSASRQRLPKRKERKQHRISRPLLLLCVRTSRVALLFYFTSFFIFVILVMLLEMRWDAAWVCALLGIVLPYNLLLCFFSFSPVHAGVGWSSAHVSFSPFVCGAFTFFPFIFSLFTCIHMYVESILIRKVFVSPRCVSLRVCRCACEFVGKAFVGCGKCCKC